MAAASLFVLAGLVVAGGCSGSGTGRAAQQTTTTGSTTTAAPATTTTTAWAPTAPQTTPDDAAARLVAAWSAGNQAEALSVAAPAATSVLLALPYPSGYLQSRGCTEGANPGTCTYRNTRTDGIYEIQVTSGPSGWYVSAVTPET